MIKPIFFDFNDETAIEIFHSQTKMPTNQLAVLYRQNVPKIFMFSILVLQLEDRLVLLILLKVFKNLSTETGYFTKMFYLKKRIVMRTEWTTNVLEWTKTISKNKIKLTEKKIETIRKKSYWWDYRNRGYFMRIRCILFSVRRI